MNEKNDFDTANIKINPDNDYPLPKRKSFATTPKNKSLTTGIFGKVEMPFVLLGIGLVAFIGIYLGLSVLSGGKSENEMVEALQNRLSNLEQKIDQMESSEAMNPEKTANTDDLKSQLDRTEATLSLRLNVIEKRLDDLSIKKAAQPVVEAVPPRQQEETVAPKKKAAPSITVAAKAKKKPSPAKIVYHKIKKGETYYSISKKYGLTVEKLQKMNNLKPEEAIFPGQKLIVKR